MTALHPDGEPPAAGAAGVNMVSRWRLHGGSATPWTPSNGPPALALPQSEPYNWLMDFKERLRQQIAEGLARVKAEQQADVEFSSQWTAIRREVHQALAEAQASIQQSQLGSALASQENGCNVLKVGRGDRPGRHEYRLEFCQDRTHRMIACRASHNLLEPEFFTLDVLKRDTVEEKIAAFVQAILDSLAAERPG